MNLNAIFAKLKFLEIGSGETILQNNKEINETLFGKKEENRTYSFSSFKSLYDEPENKLEEGIQTYMMAYSKFHSDAHYLRKGEKELVVIDGNKRLTVHFGDDGKVDYIEHVKENGEYELSEGKYGKNKEEAINKIMTLYKDHGSTPERDENIVIINKDDFQLHYKVKANGIVKKVNTVTDPKDFLGSKNQDLADKNKTAL